MSPSLYVRNDLGLIFLDVSCCDLLTDQAFVLFTPPPGSEEVETEASRRKLCLRYLRVWGCSLLTDVFLSCLVRLTIGNPGTEPASATQPALFSLNVRCTQVREEQNNHIPLNISEKCEYIWYDMNMYVCIR